MNKRCFVPEDIAGFRLPGGMIYSPDRTRLAFFTEVPDIGKNRIRFDTWLYEGSACRQLTYTADAVPVTWLNEDEILLKRNTEALPGTTQLSVISVHGGEARPFCTLPFTLGSMKRFGSDWIASGVFERDDPDGYLDPDEVRRKKLSEKEKNRDYTVLDEMPFAADGAGIRNGLRTGLFSVTFEPELKVKRITGPDISVKEYAVGEDSVVFLAGHYDRPDTAYSPTLHLYDGRRVRTLYRKRDRKLQAPFILNGDVYVQMSDMKAYGIKETPWICRYEKGRFTKLCQPAYSLLNLVNADLRTKDNTQAAVFNGSYYSLATAEDHTELLRFDEDMKEETVISLPGNISSIAVGNGRIAMIHSDWGTPPEVFELETESGTLRRITHLNDALIENRPVHELRRIDYVSHGIPLHGWAVLPENYDPKKKYPGILDIHGGPRVAYGEAYSFEKRMFAEHGYIVFFTNIPGSDGRGDAFADIRGRYGTVDYDALMDFTDAVIRTCSADPDRLAVMGLSYGGYMTSRIITKTDRFRCAMIQGPVINWISMSFLSDIGSFFGPDQTDTESIFDGERLWKTSPLRYADKVSTPALILLGLEDWRCPPWEGMQMMQALTANDVETRMVLFEGGSHNMHYIELPGIKIRRLKELLSWFAKHTG